MRMELGILSLVLVVSCAKPPQRVSGNAHNTREVDDTDSDPIEGNPGPLPTPKPMPQPTPMPRPLPLPMPVPVATPQPMPVPVPTPQPMPVPVPMPQPLDDMNLEKILSEAQFNQLFPNRITFYTYKGLVEAANATAGFAKTGDIDTRKRELAAILGNAAQESDSFKATREYNMANWDKYCDAMNATHPCKAGKQYYGRGPIQLSWNYNYGAAGEYLKLDLLNNPDLVADNPKIAFQTMMWYWMTQKGPGTITGHDAIVNGKGFGETIRSINGALECDGKLPEHINNRVMYFQKALNILGVKAVGSDRC